MKKHILALALFLMVPFVIADGTDGEGVGVDVIAADVEPEIFLCATRTVIDDSVSWGRTSIGGTGLTERSNNYAFEGESIKWGVLVIDENGLGQIDKVVATIGSTQGTGNDVEATCTVSSYVSASQTLDASCNAILNGQSITTIGFDNMAAYYDCELTVETPAGMYGEYWVTVEVEDNNGVRATIDENEYWFFNPIVAMSVSDSIRFDDLKPGTTGYSNTLLVENDADPDSRVMMDMFISGKDFYDSTPSGAMCPTTNKLALTNFRYHATSGIYSNAGDDIVDTNTYDAATTRAVDAENYVNIQYGDHWDRTMYDEAEIIQDDSDGTYYKANILSPGSEMAVTFKLNLPQPCIGEFDSGQIFFYGEAI